MLSILTDAHISPQLAIQARTHRPAMHIESLRDWHNGAYRHSEDSVVLERADDEGLTLLTYDQSTIMPLIGRWAVIGRVHSGVLFIDERTIAQEDLGGQLRALLDFWDRERDRDWKNMIDYLRRSP